MASKKVVHAASSPDQLKEEIRKTAQRIYSERQAKRMAGDELSDWLTAEAKVKAKHKL